MAAVAGRPFVYSLEIIQLKSYDWLGLWFDFYFGHITVVIGDNKSR